MRSSKFNLIFKRGIQVFWIAFFILFIFTGLTPWEIFKNSINAIKDDHETISFYVNNIQTDFDGDDYSLGWWQLDKIKGAPELSPEAELHEFSNFNSSFYSGGNFSLVAGDFKALTIENNSENEIVLVLEEEKKTEMIEVEIEEDTKDETEEITENVVASSSEKDLTVPQETGEVGTTTIETIATSSEIEIVVTEEIEDEAIDEIEIFEVEISSSSNDEVIEIIEEDDITEEISFIKKINSIFKSTVANAQEYFDKKIESLNDLGEFEGAKLRFSLGLGEKAEISELREKYVVEQEEVLNQEEIEVILEEEIVDNLVFEENVFATTSQIDLTATSSIASSSEDMKIEATSTPLEFSEVVTTSEKIMETVVATTSNETEEEILENTEFSTTTKKMEEATSSVSFMDRFVKEARAGTGDAKIIIWYRLKDGVENNDFVADYAVWHKLDIISGDQLSNALNGSYFSYELDFIESWEDIKNTEIRLEGIVPEHESFLIYIDSLWIEADYEAENELEKLKKRQRWEEALDYLSENFVFNPEEGGELRFKYNKNEERIWDTLSEMMGMGNFWSDVLVEAYLKDARGIKQEIDLNIIFEEDGEFIINLPKDMRRLSPGEYSIEFHIVDTSGETEEVFDFSKNFSWGVLAFNANKAEFEENEEAYLQFAVLDNLGHTVCDAELVVEITKPDGQVDVLRTETEEYISKIIKNSECQVDNVISTPDYYAFYEMGETGEYQVKIKAIMNSGEKETTEMLYVENEQPLNIERKGPTRIFPQANYSMDIIVKANEDFKGDINEVIPVDFKVIDYKIEIIDSIGSDPFGSEYIFLEKENTQIKDLVWKDVEILKDEVLKISYIFDAPDKSPEFYLLGPLKISNMEFEKTEKRAWQIASDALNTRARTVKFMAGVYNGASASGNQTNNDYSLPAFNFSLAETGVDIKNAFVIFETQFEAYDATGGNYTGYTLGFDACSGTSCASPFGTGAGQVLDDNSSILAYDEAESNQLRLLFDVTSETQLAAYTGGGEVLEAQVGYHLKNGTTKDSIGNAKAVLVVTYTYDKDSENITNTVSYPLDSTNGTDSGSRQASQGSCTRDTDCPKFDYKVDIPEWKGVATSTYRLSQWFRMYGANDSNNANDIDSDLNIEYGGVTDNTNSSAFHHECTNGGTQGNLPNMYFPEWSSSGYLESATQTAEVYFNTGTSYAVGGEIFETYVASSSEATKTRTVAFPIGVINNGNTTAETSASFDVLFPENGDSTGNVEVKSAWVRLIPHHFNNGADTITVSTKVGDNSTSGDLIYNYNGGGTVIKPGFTIIHIIPDSDYTELEKANATTSKTITVNTTYSDVEFGGVSAELMVTYTYTDDSNGYLTNIELFGGQLSGNPTTSASLTTANSVLPENSGKTILGASLFSSFLNSDSGNDVIAGSVFLYDADMSTTTPSCSNVFEVEPDDVNNYAEFYVDVTSAMDTTDNQSYNTCYSSDYSGDTSDGAKMGGVLSYVYAWANTAPTSTIVSNVQKSNDSGIVDINFIADDSEGDGLMVKLEYATGTTCVFTQAGDPSLDETDSNITATYQDPDIENDNEYQIGTADSYVHTASGTNSVNFDWLAESDLGTQEGYYCLRLTANDQSLDQDILSTSIVYIDTVNPTSPGALSLYSRTGTELILSFNATTTETNFHEYKIFYKQFDGTDPGESDSQVSSSTDSSLGNILFNDSATTSISGLTASTTYSIAIWSYDVYGNKASSSRVDITTNDPPTGIFNDAQTKQKTDGSGKVDISIEVDDLNNQDTLKAKIEYSTSSNCSFVSKSDLSLDENSANILADFGLPVIENDNEYQVGTSGAYILTSPGSNTIDFDWFGSLDEPSGDEEICLRLTVNDRFDDQVISATTTITIDNVEPGATGDLVEGETTTNSITLWYASTTPATDTNEPSQNAYKIFYKEGTSGVTMSDIEIDNTDLNAYDYNSATSVTVSSLTENTWYVFNIWSFDAFGNVATSTEIAIKTLATVSNDSLVFLNSVTDGPDTNVAIAGTGEWVFSATVSETNGWQVIASSTFRLANKNDDTSAFDDLVFTWDQTSDEFLEIGTDINNMVELSSNSSSTCAVNTCTLDFVLIFNKTFASSSRDYNVEFSTGNDIDVIAKETYTDFYQVKFPYVEQVHYRFRRDDGGE